MLRSFNNLSQIFNFKAKDIFSSEMVKQGTEYYRNGYVTGLKYLDSEHLSATVIGEKPYTVDIKVECGVMKTNCTCRTAGDCKHIVATYLYAQNKVEQEKSKKVDNVDEYARNFQRALMSNIGYYLNINPRNYRNVINTINEYIEKLHYIIENFSISEAIKAYFKGIALVSAIVDNYRTYETNQIFIDYYTIVNQLFNQDAEMVIELLNDVIDEKKYDAAFAIIKGLKLTDVLSKETSNRIIFATNKLIALKKLNFDSPIQKLADAIILKSKAYEMSNRINEANETLKDKFSNKLVVSYYLAKKYSEQDYQTILDLYKNPKVAVEENDYCYYLKAAKQLERIDLLKNMALKYISLSSTSTSYYELKDICGEIFVEFQNEVLFIISENAGYEVYQKICEREGIDVPPLLYAKHQGFAQVRKGYKDFIKEDDYTLLNIYLEQINNLFNELIYTSRRSAIQEFEEVIDEFLEIPNGAIFIDVMIASFRESKLYRESVGYKILVAKQMRIGSVE